MTVAKRNDRQARISRLKGRAEELEAKLECLSKSLRDASVCPTDLIVDHSPDMYFASGMYMAMSERIASNSNEMSLQKFQSVRLIMAFSDGWGHCVNEESGEEGIVPLSILKSTSGFQVAQDYNDTPIENNETKPKLVKKLSISDDILVKEPGIYSCVVDRMAERFNEISLQFGQEIRVLMVFSDGWGLCLDEITGEQGIAPLNILKGSQAKVFKQGSNVQSGYYKVLVDRIPLQATELMLLKGNIVNVSSVFSDGWSQGMNIETLESGDCPFNVLEWIEDQSLSSILKNLQAEKMIRMDSKIDSFDYAPSNHGFIKPFNALKIEKLEFDPIVKKVDEIVNESLEETKSVLHQVSTIIEELVEVDEQKEYANISEIESENNKNNQGNIQDEINDTAVHHDSDNVDLHNSKGAISIDSIICSTPLIARNESEDQRLHGDITQNIIMDTADVNYLDSGDANLHKNEYVSSTESLAKIELEDQENSIQSVAMESISLQDQFIEDANTDPKSESDILITSLTKIDSENQQDAKEVTETVTVQTSAICSEEQADSIQTLPKESIVLDDQHVKDAIINPKSESDILIRSSDKEDSEDQQDAENITQIVAVDASNFDLQDQNDTIQTLPKESIILPEQGFKDVKSDILIKFTDSDDQQDVEKGNEIVKVDASKFDSEDQDDTIQTLPKKSVILPDQNEGVANVSESDILIKSAAKIDSEDQQDAKDVMTVDTSNFDLEEQAGTIQMLPKESIFLHDQDVKDAIIDPTLVKSPVKIDSEDEKDMDQFVTADKLDLFDQEMVDSKLVNSTLSTCDSFDIATTHDSNNLANESENLAENLNIPNYIAVDLLGFHDHEKKDIQNFDIGDYSKSNVTIDEFSDSVRLMDSETAAKNDPSNDKELSHSSDVIITEIDSLSHHNLPDSSNEKSNSEGNLESTETISLETSCSNNISSLAQSEKITIEESIFATNKALILENGLKFIEIPSSSTTSASISMKKSSYLGNIPKNGQDFISILRLVRMVSIFLLAVQFFGFVGYSIVNTLLIIKSHLSSLMPLSFTAQDLYDWLGYIFIDVFEVDRFPVFTGNTLAIIALFATVWEGILIGFDTQTSLN